MMDWKAILALAVLITPIAYCTAKDTSYQKQIEAAVAAEIACIEAGRAWSGWGKPYCQAPGEP